MKKLVFLPIDSRPCTYDFPQKLLKGGDWTIIVPPLDNMDWFINPSNFSTQKDWLFHECKDSQMLILSVDQLVYGGLLTSRKNKISLDDCLGRLSFLERLKKENPNLKICIFSIIMRTSISSLSEKSQKWWELVTEFSYLYYQVKVNPSLELKQKLKEVQNKIPTYVLDEYLKVRKRNHEINSACINLVYKNVVNELVLLQEDCTKKSIQKVEQKELINQIIKYHVEEKVYLHNGTDEVASELCLRAVAGKNPIPIQIIWLSDNHNFVARYEDRPFSENLVSHLQLLNLFEKNEAKDVLIILPPKSEQFDYCPLYYDKKKDYQNSEYNKMNLNIVNLIKKGKRCYILDLTHANGGDLVFMKQLNEVVPLNNFFGYSAWNTASNSLGCILSQIVAGYKGFISAGSSFFKERLLDDLIYQGFIRKNFEKELQKYDENIWNIKNMEKAQQILEDCFDSSNFLVEELIGEKVIFSKRLRWPRTFEIEINVKRS